MGIVEYKFKRGIVGYKLKKVRWSGLSVDFFGPDLRLQLASANRRNQQRVKFCTMGEVEVCSVQWGRWWGASSNWVGPDFLFTCNRQVT